jgi:hypothetical protein
MVGMRDQNSGFTTAVQSGKRSGPACVAWAVALLLIGAGDCSGARMLRAGVRERSGRGATRRDIEQPRQP